MPTPVWVPVWGQRFYDHNIWSIGWILGCGGPLIACPGLNHKLSYGCHFPLAAPLLSLMETCCVFWRRSTSSMPAHGAEWILEQPRYTWHRKTVCFCGRPIMAGIPKKGFGSGWMWHAWWWHSPPRKFLLCQGVASLSVLPCSALVFFQIWRVLPGSQFDIHSILRSWNTTCFKFTYNSRCLFVSNWSFCWQVLPEDVKKPLRKT